MRPPIVVIIVVRIAGMLLPVARVAVAALVGGVTYHTGRNVFETAKIISQQQQQPPSPSQNRLPQSVSELQKLSRHELIHLYLHDCVALPSNVTSIQGEWNGALLNNNGLVRSILQQEFLRKNHALLLSLCFIL